jgi:hypothetical protein
VCVCVCVRARVVARQRGGDAPRAVTRERAEDARAPGAHGSSGARAAGGRGPGAGLQAPLGRVNEEEPKSLDARALGA